MIGRLCLCLCCLRSENQLESKLDDTIVARLQSAVSADIAGDLPEVGRIQRKSTTKPAGTCPAGSHKIHMVRKVERFCPDLNGLLLANSKNTRHGHIELEGSGALERVIGH